MRSEFEHEGRLISYLDLNASAAANASGHGQRGTVLLLHAFPLAAEMWEPQLASVPTGWRFIAPDLRGFGGSAADTGAQWRQPSARTALSVDDYARDALALLDHLHIADAVVCGLSMGGYAAFALARLAPARVRGLVLAATRPDADDAATRANRERMLDTLAREGVPAVADAMVPRLLGRTSHDSRSTLVGRVRQLARAQAPEAVGAAIVRLMRRPDSTPTLDAFKRPVLVVAGEEDEIAGPDVGRMMHGQLAGAELALIAGAGHLCNLEQPDEFNAALDRFLATRFIHP